jgi:hypothetical protein
MCDLFVLYYSKSDKLNFAFFAKGKLCILFFLPRVKWSFYPGVNTIKCQNRTEGHRRKKISSWGHTGKFKKERPYKEDAFFSGPYR